MSLRVKCILCGNKLIIQQDETAPLLEHIKSSHPDINITKSDLNKLNSTCEEKQPLYEIQSASLMQNNYENKKDEGYKILEGGDWEEPGKNSASNNVWQEINALETNPKDLNNAQLENTCPGNDIKIQSQETAQSQLDQMLPRESVQKFIGWQYEQNREIIDHTQKLDGLHLKQRSEHEVNIPLKVSITNNGKNSHVVYKRRYKIRKIPLQCPARSASTETLYKNSLEKWRPGRGTIFCPKCGANKHPTVKAHTDKISNSPLGAACILTCWPLCFLPCLFPPTTAEYLYCSVCDHFLGTYDRKTESIQPNTDKVEIEHSKSSMKSKEVAKKGPESAPELATDVKQSKTTN